MFIIVADDIIKDCVDNNSGYAQDRIDMLTELSLAVKHGIHIVYIPILRKNEQIKEALKSVLPLRVYYILVKNNNDQSVHVISSLVQNKLVLTANQKEYREWKKTERIVVDWSKQTNFRALYPTFLITENVLDALFYESLVLYYKKKNNIKTAKINYMPIMGGGVTSSCVACGIDRKRAGVWFAIADSDKNAPNDTEKTTATTLRDDYNELKDPLGDYYVMQFVREIENLIPAKIMREFKKGPTDFFSKDLSYYDFKLGLRLSILYDDSVYKHWKSVFTGTSFAKRNEAKKKSKDEDEYRKIVGKANVVMTNYGSTILKEIVNGNKAYLLNEIEEKDLTNAQKYEWNIIGEKIFCWTCCLKPQRA